MGYKTDICGIYKIENLINGKIYIGQSRHIKTRWTEHKKTLRKGIHNNIHLQRAWNTYGEKNFSHEVLEVCNIDELNERERFWIKYYNSFDQDFGYNLTDGGDCGRILSDETREKLKSCGYKTGMRNAKKVICLDTGEIFETITQASKKYNLTYGAITLVCQHKHNTAGDHHWLYYDEYLTLSNEDIEYYKSLPLYIRTKKVIYLNTNQVFNSIKEASENTGVPANSISLCCLGYRPTAGYDALGNPRIFKYYTETNK